MHQRTLAKLIIVGVLCWGLFHAVGAFYLNRNPARAVVVLGCVLLFLGAFATVFRLSRMKLAERDAQRRRLADEARADDEAELPD